MKKIGILDPEGKQNNPLTGKPYSPKYAELAARWSKLPAYHQSSGILEKLVANRVLLVISSTGSGKTVLVPKLLLHHFDYTGHVAITLPKQIIAKSAAEYAAACLDVDIGTSVGYKYKNSDRSAYGNNPNLLYATDGTIVAMLLKDPLLMAYDGVCIDEAHEMKVQISFLLYLLKNVLENRSDFRLVIMSATIDDAVFKKYFSKYGFAMIDVGGERKFPIESIFLKETIGKDDYMTKGLEVIKNIIQTDKNVDDGKAHDIIFFVTSINETIELCTEFEDSQNDYCVEVYSSTGKDKTLLATDKTLYKTKFGKSRKIVVATNVAESSITFDGIGFVVDSGLELHNYYDPVRGCSVLEKALISKSSAIQRMGRTGRTGPGTCYHLYTKNVFDTVMKKFSDPEILSCNLSTESLRLLELPDIKTIANLKKIYNDFLQPPLPEYVDEALAELVGLNLVMNKQLTDNGAMISRMQTTPSVGCILLAAKTLRCIREVSGIIALMDVCKGRISDIFHLAEDDKKSTEKLKIAKKKLADNNGDFMTLQFLFNEYTKRQKSDNADKWLRENYLKKHMFEAATQVQEQIFNKTRSWHVDQIALDTQLTDRIHAAITYGLRLNKATLNKSGKFDTARCQNVMLTKSSFVNFRKMPNVMYYSELFYVAGKVDILMGHIPSAASMDIVKLLGVE